MPSCKKCGAQIEHHRVDKFIGLCPVCYLTNSGSHKQRKYPMLRKRSRKEAVGNLENEYSTNSKAFKLKSLPIDEQPLDTRNGTYKPPKTLLSFDKSMWCICELIIAIILGIIGLFVAGNIFQIF